MASKKIGDVIIVLIILTFLVSGFSIFLNTVDDVVGINNSVSTDLQYLDQNLSGYQGDVLGDFMDKVDNESTFTTEEGQQIDVRGTDAGGIANTNSKNVFKAFLDISAQKLNIPHVIIYLVVALVGATITILFLRFILTEGRV